MSFFLRASLVTALSLNAMLPARGDDGVRLTTLAAASGYAYGWLGSESGVSLTRPGVVILLHAGYPVYEVNDVPLQADRPPVLVNGDLVVSSAVAARLRRIAAAHPSPIVRADDSGMAQSTATGSGTLTLAARQVPGHEMLAITGTAPPNVPVTIVVTGDLSIDLPTVVIGKTSVTSGADGTFKAMAAIDADSHRKTPITVTATSHSGITPAHATIIVVAPNPNVDSSLDAFPPK